MVTTFDAILDHRFPDRVSIPRVRREGPLDGDV